jgi:hypothetical protein
MIRRRGEGGFALLRCGDLFLRRRRLLADPDSKPKTLKELKKELPSTNEIMERLAMAQLASDYEAAMLSPHRYSNIC